MNWGKSIVLVFIVFAGFIGTMVYWMTRERIDLVRDDYYQDEIAYQHQIDRLRRTAHAAVVIGVRYQPERQQVTFTLPDSLQKATLTFYRPADRRADVRLVVTPPYSARKIVSTAHLAKGYWRVQCAWSDGRQEYYNETDLFIE
ncbi:FixH family protein [Spirosoma spitsbergense]|jgi:hypothetical protein|uniref:FixH family protein n=1 Tax=Spirosoma spitsbergense TaxID=431554 RepID=UPI0003694667|nr:FixH family protein [Spirosoma spitsbergense]